MLVEYASVVSAMALLAASLSGSYGQNVAALFASNGAGVAAVGTAARSQKVSPAGAKAAYKRAPYAKPALKYLYAIGWIGGTKNRAQCGLATIAPNAVTKHAEREIRANGKLMAQLKRRAIGARTAATALVKGILSACN